MPFLRIVNRSFTRKIQRTQTTTIFQLKSTQLRSLTLNSAIHNGLRAEKNSRSSGAKRKYDDFKSTKSGHIFDKASKFSSRYNDNEEQYPTRKRESRNISEKEYDGEKSDWVSKQKRYQERQSLDDRRKNQFKISSKSDNFHERNDGFSSYEKSRNTQQRSGSKSNPKSNNLRERNGESSRFRRNSFVESKDAESYNPRSRRQGKDHSSTQNFDSGNIMWSTNSSSGPSNLSVSHAVSDFIYSRNAVLASLKAKRRRFYQLYRVNNTLKEPPLKGDEEILKYASANGIRTQYVNTSWHAAFQRITSGAPHQGYMLEASRLPFPPVTHLLSSPEKDIDTPTATSTILAGKTISLPNDSSEQPSLSITYPSNFSKLPPTVTLITSLTDPQNLGSILRSAHFFGLAAIALPNRNAVSPSLPSVTASSSGASEAVQLLQVADIQRFLELSKKNGWFIVTAMIPDDVKAERGSRKGIFNIPGDENAVRKEANGKPLLLVLGGEERGVDIQAQRLADIFVIIKRQGTDNVGVDSLNVGVAAGVIFSEVMKEVKVGEKQEVMW